MHSLNNLLLWLDNNAEANAPTFSPGDDSATGPLAGLYQTIGAQLSGGALFEHWELLSFQDARAERAAMDQLAQDESWESAWWDPHWHPFATDNAGQLLVVDARDGRVIEFVHDDDARPVVAKSLASLCEQIHRDLANGKLVYEPTIGVVTPTERSDRAQRPSKPAGTPTPGGTRTFLSLTIMLGLSCAWLGAAMYWQIDAGVAAIGALVVCVAALGVLHLIGWAKIA